MHYKTFTVLFISFFIASCVNNKYKTLDPAITLAEKKEIKVQKRLLLSEMASATIQLYEITWPILVKNAASCRKNTNRLYGMLFADIEDIPKEDSNLFIEVFNNNINNKYFEKYKVKSFPIILSIAKKSPAYYAGLKKNDVVIQVEKKNTTNFREKLALAFKNEAGLTLTILRNNKIIQKKVIGVRGCSYNVQALPSGAPNAFADGQKVFITLAAIKLARTKDELAFLIGHEIAHNIFHFKNFNASEANHQAINYLDKPKIRNFKNVFVWSNEDREIEADIKGLSLAYNAGYTLENVNDYWRRLSIFNPELIDKSINIYRSNAYRAALIRSSLEKLKAKNVEKKYKK